MIFSPVLSASTPAAEPAPAALELALEQIKTANFFLRTSLDQVPQGVLIVDTQSTDPKAGPPVIYSNSQAIMLARASHETGLRGMGLAELTATEADGARVLATLNLAVANAGCAECQAGLQSLGGQGPTPCNWRIRAVFTDMGRLLKFIVLLSPVTTESAPASTKPAEASAAIEDLDAQSAMLRKENLAALAQGITHDVNNLIGPAVTRLSALLPQIAEDSPLGQELQLIFAGLKRAKQFTSQVVTACKATPRQSEPTDIATLVRDTVEFAGAGSNVSVRVNLDDQLRLGIADPVKLSQVLQNLVMNGIQAMPHGGTLLLRTQDQPDAQGRAGVLLEVCDSGAGLSAPVQAQLFRPFFTTKRGQRAGPVDQPGAGVTLRRPPARRQPARTWGRQRGRRLQPLAAV